jgi:hypothetical protein
MEPTLHVQSCRRRLSGAGVIAGYKSVNDRAQLATFSLRRINTRMATPRRVGDTRKTLEAIIVGLLVFARADSLARCIEQGAEMLPRVSSDTRPLLEDAIDFAKRRQRWLTARAVGLGRARAERKDELMRRLHAAGVLQVDLEAVQARARDLGIRPPLEELIVGLCTEERPSLLWRLTREARLTPPAQSGDKWREALDAARQNAKKWAPRFSKLRNGDVRFAKRGVRMLDSILDALLVTEPSWDDLSGWVGNTDPGATMGDLIRRAHKARVITAGELWWLIEYLPDGLKVGRTGLLPTLLTAAKYRTPRR